MRRQIGIQGIERNRLKKERFRQQGEAVSNMQFSQMEERLAFFRKNLEEFARKHKKDINRDPELRHHFARMCSKIGVDPLASNKGFWAELLGVGDFYYELGVQVIDVCLSTRNQNGGLMDIRELCSRLVKMRNKYSSGTSQQDITVEDVERAIRNLRHLGNGFKVLRVGKDTIVQSVPCELSSDHTAILNLERQHKRGMTADFIMKELGWTKDRLDQAMEVLLQEGFAWVDDQTGGSIEYWFPGLINMEQYEEQ